MDGGSIGFGMKNEIRRIATNNPNWFQYFNISTLLHTETKDLSEKDGVFISSMTINRKYKDEMADYIEIDLFCGLGTYVYDVFPNADNLEITMETMKQLRVNGESMVVVERYKATYLAERNNDLPKVATTTRSEMNRENVVVSFQLTDKVVMAARTLEVSGSFSTLADESNKDMKADSLMKSIFSKTFGDIEIDNKSSLTKLFIEKAKNNAPIMDVLFPTGTKLMQLGKYMQEKVGGVYQAGCHQYIQDYSDGVMNPVEKTMFVYSLYDGNKYDESEHRIDIFVSPDQTSAFHKQTHCFSGKTLKMFCQPISGLDSTKGNLLRSQGEGFRVAHNDVYDNKPVVISENGPVFDPTRVLTEVISKVQKDGLNFAPSKGITSNYFTEATEVLARAGEYVVATVNNLDRDYIYPGAPIKLYHESLIDGALEILKGVLHEVIINYTHPTLNMQEQLTTTAHPMMADTKLIIYITGPA